MSKVLQLLQCNFTLQFSFSIWLIRYRFMVLVIFTWYSKYVSFTPHFTQLFFLCETALTSNPQLHTRITLVDAGCTVHTMHHTGWSSLPGGCYSSMECSSAVCSFCAIAAAVPPRPEDSTVPVIVLFTTVLSCVTDCNFNIVRCPCNGPVSEVSP